MRRLAILRYPDRVQVDLEDAVGPMMVLVHRIYSTVYGMIKPSPQGEGFQPTSHAIMNTIEYPIFCLTGDCDWASEYCIKDLVPLLQGYGVRPTIFVTHKSPALERYRTSGVVQLGVHPNFLPGSSHGDDYLSIIDHVFGLVPNAETFRSHCFFDHTRIGWEMYRRGVRYDSNLCLYLQPHLVPLRHGTGLVRFPVFWEDDIHWEIAKGDWDLDKLLPAFLSPGLKILNFHPFFVAANIPNAEYYRRVKDHIRTLSAETIAEVRYQGRGTRSFLIDLLDRLTARGEVLHPGGTEPDAQNRRLSGRRR